MFHTAPRGHRTAPRTKIHIDKENALPSKTPSRVGATGKAQVLGAGPSTVGLNRLAPGTVLRDTRNLMATGNGKGGKGKGKEAGGDGKGDGIEPTRLFKAHINTSKSNSGLSQTLIAPRQTPAPSRTLPTQTPLPSASRTSRRSRQSFATPIRQDGWDDDLAADVSVEVVAADLPLGGLEEESDGEVEYMPPKAVELPFEPAFEHIDMAELGKALRQGYQHTAQPLPNVELEFEDIPEIQLAMSDVEEPMFAAAKSRPTSAVPAIRPIANRPLAAANAFGAAKSGLARKPLVSSSKTVRKPPPVPSASSSSATAIRRPAVPSVSTTSVRKPTVPVQGRQSSTAGTNKKTIGIANATTGTVRKPAPVSTPNIAVRRPLASKGNVIPTPKAKVATKTDTLKEMGVDFDEVLKDFGKEEYEFCL